MKVKDLKEKLVNLSDDMEVLFYSSGRANYVSKSIIYINFNMVKSFDNEYNTSYTPKEWVARELNSDDTIIEALLIG